MVKNRGRGEYHEKKQRVTQEKLLEALNNAPKNGYTRSELHKKSGVSRSAINRNLSLLVKQRKIVPQGKRFILKIDYKLIETVDEIFNVFKVLPLEEKQGLVERLHELKRLELEELKRSPVYDIEDIGDTLVLRNRKTGLLHRGLVIHKYER